MPTRIALGPSVVAASSPAEHGQARAAFEFGDGAGDEVVAVGAALPSFVAARLDPEHASREDTWIRRRCVTCFVVMCALGVGSGGSAFEWVGTPMRSIRRRNRSAGRRGRSTRGRTAPGSCSGLEDGIKDRPEPPITRHHAPDAIRRRLRCLSRPDEGVAQPRQACTACSMASRSRFSSVC